MSLHRNNAVTLSRRNNDVIIDLINKSHNAQVPHTTMHHFVTGMCTCVHFSLAKWCIVGHLSNALWDLWDGSITGDPLHNRALAHSRAPLFTQPCPHCSHSRAPGEQWARLCVFTLQGCVQAARLCRGSPVSIPCVVCPLGQNYLAT